MKIAHFKEGNYTYLGGFMYQPKSRVPRRRAQKLLENQAACVMQYATRKLEPVPRNSPTKDVLKLPNLSMNSPGTTPVEYPRFPTAMMRETVKQTACYCMYVYSNDNIIHIGQV